MFSELISGTSVQNFSRKKCVILPWKHILIRVLRQKNRVIEIIDDVTVTSFCNQSQQNFVFLFVKRIFVQNLSRSGQETKKLQKLQMTSFLKIAQQFLCLSSF